MVMGTVAFIEEGSELNLGLGIPAGAATVLAAAASIHTSRGFGATIVVVRAGLPWAALRFLGVARGAAPLALLWARHARCTGAALVQAARTLATPSPRASRAHGPPPARPGRRAARSLPDAPPPRGALEGAANAPLPQPQRDFV
ncbi:Uncharacterized protein GBIM_14514, partial [Gryllus bimaculatus]